MTLRVEAYTRRDARDREEPSRSFAIESEPQLQRGANTFTA